MASETIPHPPAKTAFGRFVAHYGSTIMGQGLTFALSILTGIMSARILGPSGRGELAAINLWCIGIATLASFGINQGVAFHLGRRNFSLSEVATATLFIGIIQSALSVAIGLVVTSIAFRNYSPEVRHIGIAFILMTPVIIFSVYPVNLFQGVQDLHRMNLIRIIAPSVYCLGLAGLYLTHRGNLQRVVFYQLFGYVVALSFGLTITWRLLRPVFRANMLAVRGLIQYGSRTQALSVSYFVNQRIDQVVLSVLVPSKELGLYAVAVSLSASISFLPQAAGIVAFSRGSGQTPDAAKLTAGGAFRTSLLWLTVTCGILFFLAPYLIHTLFGSAFDGSIMACRILLPGSLVAGLNLVLYNAAGALGRPGLCFYPEGSCVLVTALGLYVLVPRYGYIGAAVVSSAAYTISFVIMLTLAHRILDLKLATLLCHRAKAWQIDNVTAQGSG